MSGATSFLAKFVENEFHLTAGKAAVITGRTSFCGLYVYIL